MAVKKKDAAPKKGTTKRKKFKGVKPTAMVLEESLIGLILGMAPLKTQEMIHKIINRLPEKGKKAVVRKLCGCFGVTPDVKAKLKKLAMLEKLAKRR